MATASQLACRAGPAIYITLAFHRSPLTRRCLGPRPGGPQVPGATRGLTVPVKAQPRLGSPRAGEAQDSSLLWAQVLRPPPCQPHVEEGGGPWGAGSILQDRAFKSVRCPMHELQQTFQGELAAAPTVGTRGCRGLCVVQPGRQPWHHRCPSALSHLEHILCQRLQSRCPQLFPA